MMRTSFNFIKVRTKKMPRHLMTLQKVTLKAHLKLNQILAPKTVTDPAKITLPMKRTMRKYSISNC